MEGEWRNQRNTDEERTRRKSLRQRKPWCPVLVPCGWGREAGAAALLTAEAVRPGRLAGGYEGQKDAAAGAPEGGRRNETHCGVCLREDGSDLSVWGIFPVLTRVSACVV